MTTNTFDTSVARSTPIRPLAAYLILVTLLSGGFIAAMLALGQQGNYLANFYMLTPALAAILTRLFFYDKKFKDADIRLGNWRHWLAFWLIGLGVAVLTYAVFTLFGLVTWDFSGQAYYDQVARMFPGQVPQGAVTPEMQTQLALFFLAAITIVNIIPGLITGFGEEFGWRGLMFPQLYRIRPWAGFVIGGLIWFAWHIPLTLVMPAGPSMEWWQSAVNVVVLAIGSLCTFALLAYSYVRTRNILVASLLHITINNASHAIGYYAVTGTDPLPANAALALVMVLVVAILYATKQFKAFDEFFKARAA